MKTGKTESLATQSTCTHCAAAHGSFARPGPSRRRFFQTAAAGFLGGLTIAPAALRQARGESVLTPEAAIKELMDGNQRYTEAKLNGCQQDLAMLKQKTAEKQEPFAAVLSCADSRVPVELVFDQSIGELFVTRVAGNITTPEIIASLEYGAIVLGTKAIVVMGHGHCGAVKATIEGKPVPGQISALYAAIRPAIDQAGTDLEKAIRANAKIHATLLSQASPVISGLIKEKKISVAAAYYDLLSGKVTILD
jgi:carbonic anhydrase